MSWEKLPSSSCVQCLGTGTSRNKKKHPSQAALSTNPTDDDRNLGGGREDNAAADALDRALDELPALDGPWQCCNAAMFQCCFNTGLTTPPDPSITMVMSAANCAHPSGTASDDGAAAALPAPTLALSCTPSSCSPSPTPIPTFPHRTPAVSGSSIPAIAADQAGGPECPVAREPVVLKHLYTASLARGQQQLLANAAAAVCCNPTDMSQPDPEKAMDKGLSTSCLLPPTPLPHPSAELLPAFSTPRAPINTDVQRQQQCSRPLTPCPQDQDERRSLRS